MKELKKTLNKVLQWRWLPHLLSVLLFSYTAARVFLIGLTFDEICSLHFIRDFRWEEIGHTAQVHLLNAWLLHFMVPSWGETETVLRLPSLLAMTLYLWACVGLASRLQRGLGLVRVILLTMVPFVIDFFNLSRGYGQGLAFMLAAILWTVNFQRDGRSGQALLALGCGILSVVSSYTQLNTFLPIIAVVLWRTLDDAHPWSARLLRFSTLGLLAGSFLALLIPMLQGLSDQGLLYFGGRTGFWKDTVGSLGRCYAYFNGMDGLVAFLFKGLFILATAFAIHQVYLVVRGGPRGDGFVFAVILLLAIASPIVQFAMLGTNLPVERTALFYFPLLALNLTQGFTTMRSVWSRRAAYAIGGLFVLHFLVTTNLTYVYSWRYESDSRSVLQFLRQEHPSPLRLGADYVHIPSLQYQKQHLGYEGLEVVELSGCWHACLELEELDPRYFGTECQHRHFDKPSLITLLRDDIDLYYLHFMMLNELDMNRVRYSVLKSFPTSSTRLVKLERK